MTQLTDDERAALERLRPVRAGGTVADSYGHGVGNAAEAIVNYQRDCYAAVDLALREHPADEGNKIDSEWIRQYKGSSYQAYYGIELSLRFEYDHRCNVWHCPTIPVPLHTRGDVYRLLRALGIEVEG